MSPLTRRDDHGASAVEYGLVLAGIAALLVVILFALGRFTVDLFDDSCDKVGSTVTGSTC